MILKTINSYIADELANKVWALSKALEDANKTIENLKLENSILAKNTTQQINTSIKECVHSKS